MVTWTLFLVAPAAGFSSARVIDVEPVVPTTSPESLKQELLVAVAATERGQSFAAQASKHKVEELACALEDLESTGRADGRWALAYCSTQLFRSSPFWMAGRETCATEAEARRYDLFCDLHRAATAAGSIGAVRQLVDLSSLRLVSEFETKVAAPRRVGTVLPLTISGVIVSSADVVDVTDGVLTLAMDTVEIKGSTIPGLRSALDGPLKLDSTRVADLVRMKPRPQFKTTYCDDTLRIARDLPDEHLFVYVKESDDPTPTDYGDVRADLGLPALATRAVEALLG